jgi:hypothetical protein
MASKKLAGYEDLIEAELARKTTPTAIARLISEKSGVKCLGQEITRWLERREMRAEKLAKKRIPPPGELVSQVVRELQGPVSATGSVEMVTIPRYLLDWFLSNVGSGAGVAAPQMFMPDEPVKAVPRRPGNTTQPAAVAPRTSTESSIKSDVFEQAKRANTPVGFSNNLFDKPGN